MYKWTTFGFSYAVTPVFHVARGLFLTYLQRRRHIFRSAVTSGNMKNPISITYIKLVYVTIKIACTVPGIHFRISQFSNVGCTNCKFTKKRVSELAKMIPGYHKQAMKDANLLLVALIISCATRVADINSIICKERNLIMQYYDNATERNKRFWSWRKYEKLI